LRDVAVAAVALEQCRLQRKSTAVISCQLFAYLLPIPRHNQFAKNGPSISIQARAYDRYGLSFKGHDLPPNFRQVIHRGSCHHRKDGARVPRRCGPRYWHHRGRARCYRRSFFPVTSFLLSSDSSCLLPTRADIPGSLCNLDVHTHPSSLPRSWPAPVERRATPPSCRRTTLTRELPPGSARPHHLPFPPPSPTFLPSVNRLRKWARPNTIRGPRLCRRCLEESEPARHQPVSGRRPPAIPRR